MRWTAALLLAAFIGVLPAMRGGAQGDRIPGSPGRLISAEPGRAGEPGEQDRFILPPLPADHPLAAQVLSSDLLASAQRVTVFTEGPAQVLLLEGDAVVTLGVQGFRSRRAVIRIEPASGYAPGVRHLAVYLDHAESAGTAGVQMEGKGLLVTAAISGRVDVDTPLFDSVQSPPDTPLLQRANQRIAEYRDALRRPLLEPQTRPAFDAQAQALRATRRASIAEERRRAGPRDTSPEDQLVDTELVERGVLPGRGTVRYSWDRAVFQLGETEDAVMLIGNVRVLYEDQDQSRDVLLTAGQVVIFIDKQGEDPGNVPAQLAASRVRGVYLEDNAVITDGDITVRAPRAYYDLKLNRAVLLEAVVYALDTRRRVPLYMRAEVIRQSSTDVFEARGAVLTTSEFAKPHLALGADRLTLRQQTQDDGFVQRYVTARGITLRSRGTPFFYWPSLTAPAHAIPLKQVRAGSSTRNGVDVQTAWDVYALAGRRAPDGVSLLGQIDLRGDHGLGLGAELVYDREVVNGQLTAYLLPNDSGDDDIADRMDIAFDGETRGLVHLQHRQRLPNRWELSIEANYISDPSLLEEFDRDAAYLARPYESSVYLKKTEDDWALTGLFRQETNPFTAQLPQLLTPGYTVNKLPEVAYYRNGTSLFNDTLTWYHESRVGTVQAEFGSDSPIDRGFTNAQSLALFGIPNTTAFDDAANAIAFPTRSVTRFDTRNELALPMRVGIFDVTPFVVGRFTAYDQDFSTFNGGEGDRARLWGGLGTEVSTELNRTYRAANTLLDLNGLRHIIEPSVTLALYGSSLEDGDLPIYDPQVEDLAEGGVLRVGVLHTLQTRRGRHSRQRTVDWLKLRTDLVLRTDDADTATVIPRFFDHRPEFSLGGDHFYAELLWAVTEAIAVTGEVTHNFESGNVVQWRLGGEMRHTDHLSTYAHYREIDPLRSRLLTYGFSLKLTTKYQVIFSHILDFADAQSRDLRLTLDRRLPRARLQLDVAFNEIDDDTTFRLVLIPDGFGASPGSGGLLGGR